MRAMALVLAESLTARRRTWLLLAFLAGVACLLLWAQTSNWPGQVVATDVEQQRLDIALPLPAPSAPITQTFRPQRDGMREVSVLLAQRKNPAAEEGVLTMELRDEAGTVVARRTWPGSTLRHNQELTLLFAPQWRSAGQLYTLLVRGDAANPFSVWAYSADVYDAGDLSGNQGVEAEALRFTVRYQLGLSAALIQLGETLMRDGLFLLLALLFVLAPGALLLLTFGSWLPRMDAGAWWGVAVAVGAASWPLLWFWLTQVGGRWHAWWLWAFFLTAWVAIVLLLRARRPWRVCGRRARGAAWLLLLLLLVALGVRLLATRDLAFPPWVDASRHALITRVMAEEGQVLRSYAPYLPVEQVSYHYGFHTLAAGLRMMTGWPLPRLLLLLGQLLNALVVLTVYAGAWLFTRSRIAALLAAFLVALPFLFPGYYVTWGRLTQLDGVLLLPVLLALTWLLLRGARRWRAAWALLAILAAGLFFTHIRVFLIYLPFAALAAMVARGRGWRHLGLAGSLGLLLVLPRLWQLLRLVPASGFLQPASEGYGLLPAGYITTGWERAFLLLGAAAFVVVTAAALRRRKWAYVPLTLLAWSGLVTLLLSGNVPILPAIWLVNLNSAYILFFVPLALLLAIVAVRGLRMLGRASVRLQIPAYAAIGAITAATLLFGARQQVTLVNPVTVLAQPADLPGINWVATHLPESAKIGVSSWQWLGGAWAGSDGGAWILPLTGRATTTPPVDYSGDRQLFQDVALFNEAATAREDWGSPAAAAWLRAAGITHIFVGARGGFFDPAALATNPALETLYAHDGVFVFQLRAATDTADAAP